MLGMGWCGSTGNLGSRGGLGAHGVDVSFWHLVARGLAVGGWAPSKKFQRLPFLLEVPDFWPGAMVDEKGQPIEVKEVVCKWERVEMKEGKGQKYSWEGGRPTDWEQGPRREDTKGPTGGEQQPGGTVGMLLLGWQVPGTSGKRLRRGPLQEAMAREARGRYRVGGWIDLDPCEAG